MSFAANINKSITHPIVLFEYDLPVDNDILINFEAGIWYNMLSPGNATFTDDEGSLWFYSNTNTIKYNIQSLKIGTKDFLKVSSLADLRIQDGSFYYDTSTTEIYIHFEDWEPPLGKIIVLGAVEGFSTEADRERGAYYLDTYYEPRIKSVPSLKINKDPLFFGKISFNQGNVSLINRDGFFDNFNDLNAYRQAARILLGFEGDDRDEFQQIFSGYLEDFSRGFSDFSIQIQDIRKSLSRSTPVNYFTLLEYPNIDPGNIEEVKPLAYGYVKKAPVICINELEEGPLPATWDFMLADTTYHDIGNVVSVYDGDGAVIDPTDYTVDETTGILSINSGDVADTGGVNVTFYGYTDETNPSSDTLIENALDVIEDLMLNFGDISFITSNFDVTEWNLAKANAYDVGIFINSPDDLIDIIGKIIASVFGIFFSKNNGLYTCRIFDEDRTPSKTIQNYEWIGDPKIQNNGSEFLSSIRILYNQDLTEEEYSNYLNTDYEEEALLRYKAYQQRDIETLLYNEADAIAISNIQMSQSAEVKDIVTRKVKMQHYDLELGDFIIANPSTRSTGAINDFQVWEIVGKSWNLNRFEIALTMKNIKEYVESRLLQTYKTSGSSVYTGIIAVSNIVGSTTDLWLPPENISYYDGLNYDSGTYSHIGCFLTDWFKSSRGIKTVIWRYSDTSNNIEIQYRVKNSDGSIGAWSALQTSATFYNEFDFVNIKEVQFRCYLDNTTTTLYLDNIIEN